MTGHKMPEVQLQRCQRYSWLLFALAVSLAIDPHTFEYSVIYVDGIYTYIEWASARVPPTPLLGGWAEGGWCGACLIDDDEDDGDDHDEHDDEDDDDDEEEDDDDEEEDDDDDDEDEVIAVVWAHCGHTKHAVGKTMPEETLARSQEKGKEKKKRKRKMLHLRGHTVGP